MKTLLRLLQLVMMPAVASPAPAAAAPVVAAPAVVVKCGIVVAGGSAASLAAAITAAATSPAVTVCLTDPTDWLGGQMTASAVSAIDFGANRKAHYQSKSFRELMVALGSPANPGVCWVSTMCYEPRNLLERYIRPTLAKLPNLRVLYRTVITATKPCGGGSGGGNGTHRRICALSAVQRQPKLGGGATGWNRLLSEAVEDWYSPAPSSEFNKSTLELQGEVFIDATEFGDVLVTGAASSLKLPVAQGVEVPTESSNTTNDQCGQAATLTFYMGIRPTNTSAPAPAPVPAGGTAPAGGTTRTRPFSIIDPGRLTTRNWDQIWTYRRARVGPKTDKHNLFGVPGVGDLTQQNWGGGNDLDNVSTRAGCAAPELPLLPAPFSPYIIYRTCSCRP